MIRRPSLDAISLTTAWLVSSSISSTMTVLTLGVVPMPRPKMTAKMLKKAIGTTNVIINSTRLCTKRRRPIRNTVEIMIASVPQILAGQMQEHMVQRRRLHLHVMNAIALSIGGLQDGGQFATDVTDLGRQCRHPWRGDSGRAAVLPGRVDFPGLVDA